VKNIRNTDNEPVVEISRNCVWNPFVEILS